MGRPINLKCVECAKTRFSPLIDKPECYKPGACEKKKCYYRKIEKYRQTLRNKHEYLRFKDDKCFTCGNKETLEVHHIKAQSIGGESIQENVMTICKNCHVIITSYHRGLRIRYSNIEC